MNEELKCQHCGWEVPFSAYRVGQIVCEQCGQTINSFPGKPPIINRSHPKWWGQIKWIIIATSLCALAMILVPFALPDPAPRAANQVEAAGDNIMMGLLIVAFTIALLTYLLPSGIAGMRHAKNHHKIFLVNIFLGWTVLGWIAALAWAVTDQVE